MTSQGQHQEVETLAELADLAHTAPTVTQLSDLAAHLLETKHGLEIIDGFDTFCQLFESPTHQFERDVIIRDQSATVDLDRALTTYTPPEVIEATLTGSVYTPALNTQVKENWLSWDVIGETTLRQSAIADHIVAEAAEADVIALVIVDGLSYADWTDAGYTARPVYVDCPTKTDCGYVNVVRGGSADTSLSVKLYNRGFTRRHAFTYWEKERNDLTRKLHQDFSTNDVVGTIQDFSDTITYLRENDWYHDSTYLQITLTGPERVAHKHREDPNIPAEVTTVHDKLTNLRSVLGDTGSSFNIYATADHGILWRMDVADGFQTIDGDWDHYERRCIEDPPPVTIPADHGFTTRWGGTEYLRLNYPYVFSDLRSNEPGTHGGFSFQESIVPLIELS